MLILLKYRCMKIRRLLLKTFYPIVRPAEGFCLNSNWTLISWTKSNLEFIDRHQELIKSTGGVGLATSTACSLIFSQIEVRHLYIIETFFKAKILTKNNLTHNSQRSNIQLQGKKIQKVPFFAILSKEFYMTVLLCRISENSEDLHKFKIK